MVAERSFRGGRTRLTLRHASGTDVQLDLDEPDLPAVGMPLTVRLRPDGLSLIPEAA
jgi:hypothetical protein